MQAHYALQFIACHSHICAWTGLAPATSALGLRLPLTRPPAIRRRASPRTAPRRPFSRPRDRIPSACRAESASVFLFAVQHTLGAGRGCKQRDDGGDIRLRRGRSSVDSRCLFKQAEIIARQFTERLQQPLSVKLRAASLAPTFTCGTPVATPRFGLSRSPCQWEAHPG